MNIIIVFFIMFFLGILLYEPIYYYYMKNIVEGNCENGQLVNTFSPWCEIIKLHKEIIFPITISEVIRHCNDESKIRVSGAAHSNLGVVIGDDDDDKTAVISLTNMDLSGPWEKWMLKNTITDNKIRVEAGKSFKDLYKVIRPQNYFLPTQTAGGFFTIGGVIQGPVHGGVFGKGMINEYVTGLLVIDKNNHNSTWEVREIPDIELKHWRCSFGSLGIILAVEFELEYRINFEIKTISDNVDLTEDNFKEYITKIENNHKYKYAEFFLDPRQIGIFSNSKKNIKAIVFTYDTEEGTEDNTKLEKKYNGGYNISKCGVNPTLSLSKSSIFSIDTNYTTKLLCSYPKTSISSTMNILSIDTDINNKNEKDGFWVESAPCAMIMAYYVEFENAYKFIEHYISFYKKNNNDEIVNQPCEFRIVQIKGDKNSLYNIPDGKYMVCEYLLIYNDECNDDVKRSLEGSLGTFENKWLDIVKDKDINSYPHLSKRFNIKKDNYYQNNYFPRASDESFKEYKKKCDPENKFTNKFLQNYFRDFVRTTSEAH
jgi:hypothetical protein